MQTNANANFNHNEDYQFLSTEDRKILQSLKETLFIANQLKQQTGELNKSLSKKYSLGIFKWKK